MAAGEELYGHYCPLCHGFDAQSANIVPDLRRSPFLTTPEGWQEVVEGGILSDRGMVSWNRFVDAKQAEQIRLYVGEKSRALQRQYAGNAGQPVTATPLVNQAH